MSESRYPINWWHAKIDQQIFQTCLLTESFTIQMALVTIQNLTIGFRGPNLLDGADCQIEAGQHIGLLGRNGAGKTTLLRLLAGQLEPDEGVCTYRTGTKVAMLSQDVSPDLFGTIAEIVASGWQDLLDHEQAAAWRSEQAVKQICSRMELDADTSFEFLSSGMKRRVLLARAIVALPDLLLLDEPTNHLDIEAILWLEDFLAKWQGTLVFVTHDRMFLRKIAGRILEIDRGQLFDWSCNYDTFQDRKEALLAAEDSQNKLFEKKLTEEEVWIRQGIKARRKRNEGRVRALIQMRRQRNARHLPASKIQMEIQEGRRSGNLVAAVKNVSFGYGDAKIIRAFTTVIMRGDKVGIIGRNGVGKTTLLRILLGELSPDSGEVRLGTNLQIAYFDQLRGQLKDNETVQDNVADGYDTIRLDGKTKHVIGYLQDFLFTPERARTPIRFLSGGERNRVLLAKLFAKPANVIVLDEPTNDLDTETLELLEERLVNYSGTILIVSHDREFLNSVVTSSIVFESVGIKEYVGGYDDWLRQRSAAETNQIKPAPYEPKSVSPKRNALQLEDKPRRMTYKEKQELGRLPVIIETLELEIAILQQAMAKPEFYQQPRENIVRERQRLDELEAELVVSYERWETLEMLGG